MRWVHSFALAILICLKISDLATADKCTSSGPSARRKVRAWAYLRKKVRTFPVKSKTFTQIIYPKWALTRNKNVYLKTGKWFSTF